MRVLVTGAAGTIGYQAIRQMASVPMMCRQQICLEKRVKKDLRHLLTSRT